MQGAWIEIACNAIITERWTLSLPVQGAWIEMGENVHDAISFASLPVQGAWIEIFISAAEGSSNRVAPRAGSVD